MSTQFEVEFSLEQWEEKLEKFHSMEKESTSSLMEYAAKNEEKYLNCQYDEIMAQIKACGKINDQLIHAGHELDPVDHLWKYLKRYEKIAEETYHYVGYMRASISGKISASGESQPQHDDEEDDDTPRKIMLMENCLRDFESKLERGSNRRNSSNRKMPLNVPVAPEPEVAIENAPCNDFLAFQDILRKMRIVDDKIVYALNSTIPTESFRGSVDAGERCRQLYHQLKVTLDRREHALKRCANEMSDSVSELVRQKESSPGDLNVLKSLGKQQNSLRLIRSELYVEDILRDRTFKVFFDKCRHFYTPDDAQK
ncbi:unnamed protein product [Notodromas monacha]|uniref:Protein MIX23 n=1 Tax=Notodromas monacha TaxID=399045 RepID=A0A7R9BUW7_9CRUS|nr:unnamed protein product [Notodromas monacha]CAG0922195.1 unnamed protein product [Notodromas monacha]